MSESRSASGGIGLSGAVFIVFLVLRMTDHIDWGWYWVAAPLWMPVALVLGLVALIGGPLLLLDWRERRQWRKKRAERAKGKPATTASVDRITKEFADAVVRASYDDAPRPHSFMRRPK